MIPPPVSGLSVDSDAGPPPSAPAGIVNAGGFFLDIVISLQDISKYRSASSFPKHVQPHSQYQSIRLCQKKTQKHRGIFNEFDMHLKWCESSSYEQNHKCMLVNHITSLRVLVYSYLESVESAAYRCKYPIHSVIEDRRIVDCHLQQKIDLRDAEFFFCSLAKNSLNRGEPAGDE